jgi:hypothetical protein
MNHADFNLGWDAALDAMKKKIEAGTFIQKCRILKIISRLKDGK